MRKKKLLLLRLAAVSGLGAAALWLWTARAESRAHYTPDYEKEELNELLTRESLTEEEYNLLLLQTGLGPSGVDQLFREGRQDQLLYLQERFFMPVEYECRQVNIFCRGERLIAPAEEEERDVLDFFPTARTGDILVSFSGHVFGWRSGHAGLVVDGEAGLTLEAVSPGNVSEICSLESWKEYPSFALLRLKDCTEEEAEEIASYAAANLTEIPYHLFCVTGNPQEQSLSGTQCAHLVWSAFSCFGYDLDGDGGRIVTPRDLYESELLEVIQVYGISPLRKP